MQQYALYEAIVRVCVRATCVFGRAFTAWLPHSCQFLTDCIVRRLLEIVSDAWTV